MNVRPVIVKTIRLHHLLMALFLMIFLSSCGGPESLLRSVTRDEGIEIMEGDSKVLFYQVKPKSLNGEFERSNYIHPLYSLAGNVITEDFPEDHPHHHGIYSAWHQILLNGKMIGDGWIGKNISWNVVKAEVTDHHDRITISSDVRWQYSLLGQQAEPIVNETLKISVHESSDQRRIIDYDIYLLPLKDSLSIGGSEDEKGYGGFSLRLKLPEDIRFVAKGGEVEAQVQSIEAGHWMNFKGSFDGKDEGEPGVLVLCHPSNPGSPQPWILRKAKSMQNPAFPGREPVALSRDGLRLRYRMIIHEGGLEEEDIEEIFREYVRIQ